MEKRLRSELSRAHRERPLEPGVALERLRAAVAPAWDGDAFRDFASRLVAAGGLAQQGDALRLATHRTELEGEARRRYERLLDALVQAGLAALAEADWLRAAGLGPEAAGLPAFALRRREALRLSDGAYVSAAAWDGLVARLRAEAAAGRATLDVPEFKDLFGLSRKYAIPLLEKLDDLGITQRVGTTRRFKASFAAGAEASAAASAATSVENSAAASVDTSAETSAPPPAGGDGPVNSG